MFEAAAWVIAFFYGLVPDYSFALAMVAVVVMLLITPLTLKSTKGMLEMQRLQPEMKKIDRKSTRLNSSHGYQSRMPSSA